MFLTGLIPMSGSGWHCLHRLDPPIPIINQENAPIYLPAGQSDRGILLKSFFLDDPNSCQIVKTNRQTKKPNEFMCQMWIINSIYATFSSPREFDNSRNRQSRKRWQCELKQNNTIMRGMNFPCLKNQIVN